MFVGWSVGLDLLKTGQITNIFFCLRDGFDTSIKSRKKLDTYRKNKKNRKNKEK